MPRRRQPETKVDQLLDDLLSDYKTPEQIFGEQGLVKLLTKRLVERALQAELGHHLSVGAAPEAEETDAVPGRNSRNGFSKKTVKTELGELPLQIPRDRQGTFEPILVPKGQRRLSGLDEKIIALYARGLSTRDIQSQLEELYGVAISAALISQVTDAVMDEVRQWQNRPLDALYPIVYLDALQVKVRQEGRVSNQAVYVVLGINFEGEKEVLGLWISEGV